MNPETSIGELIRNRRKDENLKLTELAEKVDVTMITAYRWEHGIARPNKTNIPALAKVLHVSPAQLRKH